MTGSHRRPSAADHRDRSANRRCCPSTPIPSAIGTHTGRCGASTRRRFRRPPPPSRPVNRERGRASSRARPATRTQRDEESRSACRRRGNASWSSLVWLAPRVVHRLAGAGHSRRTDPRASRRGAAPPRICRQPAPPVEPRQPVTAPVSRPATGRAARATDVARLAADAARAPADARGTNCYRRTWQPSRRPRRRPRRGAPAPRSDDATADVSET